MTSFFDFLRNNNENVLNFIIKLELTVLTVSFIVLFSGLVLLANYVKKHYPDLYSGTTKMDVFSSTSYSISVWNSFAWSNIRNRNFVIKIYSCAIIFANGFFYIGSGLFVLLFAFYLMIPTIT